MSSSAEQKNIQSDLQELRLFPPPGEFAAAARLEPQGTRGHAPQGGRRSDRILGGPRAQAAALASTVQRDAR